MTIRKYIQSLCAIWSKMPKNDIKISQTITQNSVHFLVPTVPTLFKFFRKEESPTQIQKKREDYLDWRDYFMAVAVLAAKRSKDPNRQVGACIVNKEMKIVGVG